MGRHIWQAHGVSGHRSPLRIFVSFGGMNTFARQQGSVLQTSVQTWDSRLLRWVDVPEDREDEHHGQQEPAAALMSGLRGLVGLVGPDLGSDRRISG